MKKVTVVAHPETGNIITQSKNLEYGTIRVDAKTVSFENGFLNTSNRVAFIRGKMTDLQSLGLKAGDTLPGIIQKQEQFEPFYEGQSPKINPSTGEVILKEGREIFLQYVYTSDVNAPTNVFFVEAQKETIKSGQDL